MQQHKPEAVRIIEAISAVLETEAPDINVDVYDKRVVLTGVVDVLQDKIAAEQAVESVMGDFSIENRLTISTDGTITDQEIQEAVERKLAKTRLTVPGIEVHSGRVYLRGRVENLMELSRIVERTSEVLGVAEVDTTQLLIEGNTDDATLKNRIEAALANLASAPDIDTEVIDGIVELRGYIPTPGHRIEVNKVVQAIDGVQKLEDHLRVRRNQADT